MLMDLSVLRLFLNQILNKIIINQTSENLQNKRKPHYYRVRLSIDIQIALF